MKLFTKSWIVIATVAMMTFQSHHAQAQKKLNFGISEPSYFGAGRFGSYLDMTNEVQEHSGSDALRFTPVSLGVGLFGELEFESGWRG